jgi:hypothetical protein
MPLGGSTTYAGPRRPKARGRVEFVATCSCKHWQGYASSEKVADSLARGHVRDVGGQPSAAHEEEHVVTVHRAGFWE